MTPAMFVPATIFTVTFFITFSVTFAIIVAVAVKVCGDVGVDVRVNLLAVDCGFKDYGCTVSGDEEEIRAFGGDKYGFPGPYLVIRGLIEDGNLH